MKHCYLYRGRLTHSRLSPKKHSFTYRVFMVYLDLDDLYALPSTWWWGVNQRKLIAFHDEDYLDRKAEDLRSRVKRFLFSKHSIKVSGPIRMLTNIRTLGFCFNPVTFYYCYDHTDSGEKLKAIVADINNTPWNEKHAYVLPLSEITENLKSRNKNEKDNYLRFPAFAKKFHVSPFFPLNHEYDWKFTFPGLPKLGVNMRNLERNNRVFSANLNLKREEFSLVRLLKISLTFPFITLKVFLAIYFQALKLFLKRVPFFDHPNSAQ